MSDSWTSLREYAESWVDQQIAAETDPEARAVFICNWDTIVAKVEATMTRQLAEQVAAYDAELH